MENIEEAIDFIEDNTDENTKIDRAYISHLHNIVVQKLTPPPRGEGSKYPGELRKDDVEINGAEHVPPTIAVLKDLFDEFVKFVANPVGEQNQLLMVAIAHHRFMHIHPFDNGNGRMGRLLNYALLIQLGFNVKSGRIINPSSVFYTDRDKYYEMLGVADSLTDGDLLQWAEYFLNGLTNQIHKIDGLMNIAFVREQILLPTLKIALDRANITKQEFEILSYLVKSEEMTIKASELDQFGIHDSQQKSYVMAKLRDNKMVKPITDGGRISIY